MKSQSTDKSVRSDRRRFMKTMALGGAAVGLGATATSAIALEPVDAPAAVTSQDKKGYHETEHVNTYYRMADF